jgi:hypothetical protein
MSKASIYKRTTLSEVELILANLKYETKVENVNNWGFESDYGRIERRDGISMWTKSTQFESDYGRIESQLSMIQMNMYAAFESDYGRIERGNDAEIQRSQLNRS